MDFNWLALDVTDGLDASDLAGLGGELALGPDGTLLLPTATAPNTTQADTLLTALLAIRGQRPDLAPGQSRDRRRPTIVPNHRFCRRVRRRLQPNRRLPDHRRAGVYDPNLHGTSAERNGEKPVDRQVDPQRVIVMNTEFSLSPDHVAPSCPSTSIPWSGNSSRSKWASTSGWSSRSIRRSSIGSRSCRSWPTKSVAGLTEVCHAQADLPDGVDRDRLAEELPAEVFGLGPLEQLMQDPGVSDILVNDPYNVYVERNGCLELTDCIFADEDHLMRIIQRIVGRLGRRIDETSPMVDARSARRLARQRHHSAPGDQRSDLVDPAFWREPAADGGLVGQRLAGAADCEVSRRGGEARIACVVSGGTGAGKTTLLNVMSAFIPDGGTHDHHRRLGGTEVPAPALGAAGSAAPQRRRRGRSDPARPGAQLLPHASRSDYRGRSARRRKSGTCCRP